LTVEGLGSATDDISVTAAGVEKLAITSNAAASAAVATNYLNLSAVDVTEITAGGGYQLALECKLHLLQPTDTKEGPSSRRGLFNYTKRRFYFKSDI